MEEFGCQIALVIGLVVLVAVVVLYALAFVYCLLCGIAFGGMLLLDAVFLGRLVPSSPYAGYALSGLLIGAALGFWTIAPAYGLRKARPAILAVPLVVLAGLMLFVLSRGEAAPPAVSSTTVPPVGMVRP